MPEKSEKLFTVPEVATHFIESKHVGQTYRIQVMQPLAKKGSSERFPVLYLTDGNLFFDCAKDISHSLQIVGQVRRYILVGIGYPGTNPFAGNLLRGRDLTPEYRPGFPDLPRSSPIEGVPGIEEGAKNWNGASEFLDFIQHELHALIDAKYPTDAHERAYFGHSLGGGLGLHTLFFEPGIFNKFIISSPGVSYDGDDHTIGRIREFVASGRKLDAQLFMTVGELEEFEERLERTQFVSSFYRLAALLRKARIPGLDFTSRVYPGETHLSVAPFAFTHGVQSVFGSAAIRPLAQ